MTAPTHPPNPSSPLRSLARACFAVRGVRGIVVGILTLAAALVLTATPALALETHTFSTSFGAAGPGPGQLSLASESGLAVVDVSGPSASDLYVADTANHRVDEFNPAKPPAEQFIRAWGWGVRNGAEELQACTEATGCQAGISGSKPGQLQAPVFIAVDDSSGASKGDVYVADRADNLITKFDSEGSLIATWGNNGPEEHPNGQLDIRVPNPPSPTGQVAGLAVDSEGNLFAADTHGNLLKFTAENGAFVPEGSFRHEYVSGLPGALAIDGSGFFFYLGPSGGVIRTPGQVFLTPEQNTGLALDPATDDLYTAAQGSSIEHFPPSCVLEGKGKYLERCEFTDSFGQGHLSGAFGLALDTLAGPLKNDLYAADVGNQRIDVFSPAVVPDRSDEPASSIGPAGATLNGTVDPAGAGGITECRFQYVTVEAFNESGFNDLSSGGTEPCEQPTPISSPTAVTATATGLTTETEYRYRLIAANANGQNSGSSHAGQDFTTLSAATALTGEATAIAPTSATLNASVDPAGHPDITDCHFEYLDAAAFKKNPKNQFSDFSGATHVPCEQPTPISTPTVVTAALTGLRSGTIYHFRISIANADGTTLGKGQTFSTPSHLFAATFAGSGAKALSEPTDLAIDQQSHDVYVADPANHRVEKFTSSGQFILMFGKGVDKTTGGDVCPEHPTDVCQPGTSASSPGAFVGTGTGFNETDTHLFLAVDNSPGGEGDVYVGDLGDNLVSKFDSEGKLIRSWAASGQLDGFSYFNNAGEPTAQPAIGGVAVDSAGHLLVLDREEDIYEFAPDSAFRNFSQLFFFSSGAKFSGLTLDSAGNLYVLGFFGDSIFKFPPSGGSNLFLDPPSVGQSKGDQGLAISPSGNLFPTFGAEAQELEPTGPLLNSFGPPHLLGPEGIAIDALTGNAYVADPAAHDVAVFDAVVPGVETGPTENLGHTTATVTGHLDPLGRGPVDQCGFEYGTEAGDYSLGTVPCAEGQSFSAPADVHVALTGLTPGTTYHYRLRASNATGATEGADRTFFPPFIAGLKTGPATEITPTSATITGSFTAEAGLTTHYYFEYGKSANYKHKSPEVTVPGPASGTKTENVSAALTGLVAGETYHYRLVATNEFGTTEGEDESFQTVQHPTIESFSSSDLSATGAVLHARIDPQGSPTACHFEYGTTTGYGQSAPCPAEITEELFSGHSVKVELTGLQPGATYHFRVLAHNQWGTGTSEDQTFEFFSPSCPNSAVRQQTGSVYLPDCRAYELASPRNANGTLLFAGGPNPGTATNPSRFAYVGAFSSLPEAGNTINTAGDLYVATRTDTGWVSRYIGLSGSENGCMGGPPANENSTGSFPGKIQNWVLADPDMDRFLDWADGIDCILGGGSAPEAKIDVASNAPYLWSSAGSLLAHLPTDLASTPEAATALACPGTELNPAFKGCTGEVTASGDLSHLLFSSRTLDFTEGEQAGQGLTKAPGSAYDNDIAAGKVTLVSRLADGEPIAQDPKFAKVPPVGGLAGQSGQIRVTGGKEEFIHFPAISTDGSRILMSTATAGDVNCPGVVSPEEFGELGCPSFTDTPVHLYMRVNDLLTYEIAESPATHEPAAVNFVGITPDGSRVYFTSEEHLTGEDPNHEGSSLYMWNENGGNPTLTLISKPDPGSPPEAGATGNCGATWVAECGVLTYSAKAFSHQAGVGGNGRSDNFIAAENGDVYFYSPEQLDGDRGVPGQQNLYDYREGRVQYVTTLGNGPLVRMEVSPNDSHMAFLTASRLTSYDNAGQLEMYSYTPATGQVVCDSCNPDGRPATAGVIASQDGLFMTDDGRTFFSTTESLVPADTNEAEDVYEFVEGRPQLITSGTGTVTNSGQSFVAKEEIPGLVGVSANGTDVYFSTYDNLIAEDRNGSFLKFYDARTDGGFRQPAPAQPCAAAEECHGPGAEVPPLPTQGTAAELAGGNATPATHTHHHKKHVRHERSKKHRAKHHRKGSVRP